MIATWRAKACFGFRSLGLVLAAALCAATLLQDAILVAQGPPPSATLPKVPSGSNEKSTNPDDWEAQLLRDLGIDAAGSQVSRAESQPPADAQAQQRPPSEAQAVVELMRSVAGSLRSGSLAPDTLERQRSILQWLDQWFPSVDAPTSADSQASDRSASGESPSAEEGKSESGSKGQDGSQGTDSGNPSDAASAGKEGPGESKEPSMGAGGDSQQVLENRDSGSGNSVSESAEKSSPSALQDGSGQATESSQPDGKLMNEGGNRSRPDGAPSADNAGTGANDVTGEPKAGGQGGESQGGDQNGASDGVSEGPPSPSSDTGGSQGGDPASPPSAAGGGRKAGRPGEGDGTGQSGRLTAGSSGGGRFQEKIGEPSRGRDGVDQAAWNDPSRLRRGVWGHLPQQVHQQMLAAPSTEFLPSHRKAIEAYYRRLSEAKR